MEKRQVQAVAPGGLERGYKREMPREKQPNVDPAKTPMNRYITKGANLQLEDRPGTLYGRIQERIREAQGDKTVRKDAVVDMEFILSGSHDTFEKMSKEEMEDWAKDSYQFMADTFGEENIVEAVLHLDETTPHIHMHVVPVVKNPDGSRRLCAKDLTKRDQLRQLHTEYARRVEKYGFQRSSKGKGVRHRDPHEHYRDLQKKVDDEKRKLNTRAKVPEGKLPALSPEGMSGGLKESIGRQQVFGGQQQREGIARSAAEEQREMDQKVIDSLSKSYSYSLAGAEKKVEEVEEALKEMTGQRDAWYNASVFQSQRLDQFYARDIAENPAAEAPAKAEVLGSGFNDTYLKANFPRLFEGEIQLQSTVPWMNDFSIRRLTEVSKPNTPEAIDDTIRTVRTLPVNTGFLTCADSPETYKRKLDWTKLSDKERRGIVGKVCDLFRNLAYNIRDRLKEMLQLGKVNVKAAIRELHPKMDLTVSKADVIQKMQEPLRHRSLGPRL